MDVPILPPAGDSSVEDHLAISRWLIARARGELASDRLQASEKGWGAVAHLLKAIARARGWRNQAHSELSAAAVLLAGEFERPHLLDYLTLTQAAHSNYYQNNMEVAQIESAMEAAESYLVELNQILREWPREYAIENEDQQRLLNRVLNRGSKRPFALGTYSLVGFSQLHLAERRETGDREVSVPIPGMDQVRQATLASPAQVGSSGVPRYGGGTTRTPSRRTAGYTTRQKRRSQAKMRYGASTYRLKTTKRSKRARQSSFLYRF